jgi:hypothetical protein
MQTFKMYSTIFKILSHNQAMSNVKQRGKNNLLRHCARCPFHFNAQQRPRDRFFSIQITSRINLKTQVFMSFEVMFDFHHFIFFLITFYKICKVTIKCKQQGLKQQSKKTVIVSKSIK